jgi:hypothetical protein
MEFKDWNSSCFFSIGNRCNSNCFDKCKLYFETNYSTQKLDDFVENPRCSKARVIKPGSRALDTGLGNPTMNFFFHDLVKLMKDIVPFKHLSVFEVSGLCTGMI